jgi:hypothetical protein
MATPDRPDNKQGRPVPPPGPNTGGMGSVGQQPDEPTLEKRSGVDRPGQRGEKQPHPNPGVREGAPDVREK